MKKLISLVLTGACVLALAGCQNNKGNESQAETTGTEATNAESSVAETEGSSASAEGAVKLQIGQIIAAVHGTKSFAVTSVVLNDDTIVDSYIDEYQYLSADEATGVPNSAEGLKDSVVEGQVLASKRVNDALYSEMMAEKGGATTGIADNIDAIQDFVKGKTVTELEALLKEKTPEEVLDAVSGATLVDTSGYITSVIDAAKAAKASAAVDYDGDVTALKLSRVDGAAHGSKCFTIGTTVADGKVIVLSYIDEFQYMAVEDGAVGVANSEGMKDNVAEGIVLVSKRENNKLYSEMMAEKGGATVEIATNYDAVQDFVNGKEIAELETLLKDKKPEDVIDAVSGATLLDTTGYIGVLLDSVK